MASLIKWERNTREGFHRSFALKHDDKIGRVGGRVVALVLRESSGRWRPWVTMEDGGSVGDTHHTSISAKRWAEKAYMEMRG